MDMYVRMYDEWVRAEGDNPTIGIVLCSETDDDIARYSVLHDNNQLFASKYMLYMPTEEELRNEIERQKTSITCSIQQRSYPNKKMYKLPDHLLITGFRPGIEQP